MVIIIYKFVIPEGNAGVENSEANPEYMEVFNITVRGTGQIFPVGMKDYFCITMNTVYILTGRLYGSGQS